MNTASHQRPSNTFKSKGLIKRLALLFKPEKAGLTTICSPVVSLTEPQKGQPFFRGDRLRIADTVQGRLIDDTTVNFFLYIRDNLIRIVARRNGVARETFFTPDIASARNQPFTIHGAIQWVETEDLNRWPRSSSNSEEVASTHVSEAKAEVSNDRPVAVPSLNRLGSSALTAASSLTPAKNSRPFRGRIISLGVVTRPATEDKPAYETYVIKLRRESDGIEREFAGEHLADLAGKHCLAAGQFISLQLIGRRRFVVEDYGRKEERYRNEYFIEVLKKRSR